MKKLAEIFDRFMPHTLYVIVMPTFFLAFCLLYDPFDIMEDYSFGTLSYTFHLLMLASIIFVTILTTRITYYRWSLTEDLPLWKYILWCIAEVFICSCFFALYTDLFKQEGTPFFTVLSRTMKYVYLILIYPYVFLVMGQIIQNKVEEISTRYFHGEQSLLKFHDEHKRLKFSISPQAILFVKAENNYIKIFYLDSGRVKEFLLRNSMKSIENAIAGSGLVRCQRSYLINPSHITILRKDKDGFIYADLDNDGASSVPVSKQYYDSISALL